MSSRVNPVLVGLYVLGLCSSKMSPVRGVCSRGGTPLGHELRAALPQGLSSHRPPRPRNRDGDVRGAVPQRLCSYERCVHRADWGDGSPGRPRGGFAWLLEAEAGGWAAGETGHVAGRLVGPAIHWRRPEHKCRQGGAAVSVPHPCSVQGRYSLTVWSV